VEDASMDRSLSGISLLKTTESTAAQKPARLRVKMQALHKKKRVKNLKILLR